MHNADVGGDDTDYRSLAGTVNNRSVQVVIGPPVKGMKKVYADRYLYILPDF